MKHSFRRVTRLANGLSRRSMLKLGVAGGGSLAMGGVSALLYAGCADDGQL